MAGSTWRVDPDQPYWGVVTGSEAFPILGGSHYGARVDLDEADGYEWGRVFTTPEAAEAHRQVLVARQRDTTPADRERRGLLDPDVLEQMLRVQCIVHPAGAALSIWYPAEAVAA